MKLSLVTLWMAKSNRKLTKQRNRSTSVRALELRLLNDSAVPFYVLIDLFTFAFVISIYAQH